MAEEIVISSETLGLLALPKIMEMVSLALLGQRQRLEKPVSFFAPTDEGLTRLEGFCANSVLGRFPNNSPSLYSTALRLAKQSPYSAAQTTALQRVKANMADWHVRDEKMPKSLWGNELVEARQKKHIQEICFSLLEVGLTDPHPEVRAEAASTLSLLAQTAYDPAMGVKNPEKSNFLEHLLSLAAYEEEPVTAMKKRQALFELTTNPQFLKQLKTKGKTPEELLTQIDNVWQTRRSLYATENLNFMRKILREYEEEQFNLKDQIKFEQNLRGKQQGNWSDREFSNRQYELRVNKLILSVLEQQYLNRLGIGPNKTTS